jgi:hypothetical protein
MLPVIDSDDLFENGYNKPVITQPRDNKSANGDTDGKQAIAGYVG